MAEPISPPAIGSTVRARDTVLSDETLAHIDAIDEAILTPMTEDGLRRL